MNKLLLAAMLCGLGVVALSTRAEDAKEGTWTGVLIDNACGAKNADEAAAEKHPLACCKKPACEASGYQLVVGDKHIKFDDKGNERAKEYLSKAESTKVTVEGKLADEKLTVTSIKAAEKKEAK